MHAACIRVATGGDASSILSTYAPIVAETAISFEIETPSVQQMSDRIEERLRTLPWIVAEEEGAVVAYAHASRFRTREAYAWSVETSVYVAESARSRGIARSLYEVLHRLLRAQGYVTALAAITLPNAPSVALHEAMGFAPVGTLPNVGFKLGEWRDVGWWSRALSPGPADPSPPVRFEDFRSSAEFESILAPD